jgi:hypothetical protein
MAVVGGGWLMQYSRSLLVLFKDPLDNSNLRLMIPIPSLPRSNIIIELPDNSLMPSPAF